MGCSENALQPDLGAGYSGVYISKHLLIFDLCPLLYVSFTLRK